MGLWLEYRENGVLTEREPFVEGVAEFVAAPYTIAQAVQLAKLSAHMPVEKRDWSLRIVFGD
jgi:hypothetical protein